MILTLVHVPVASAFLLIRVYWIAYLFATAQPVAVIWALIECVSVVLGTGNLLLAKSWDVRPCGLLVPFCYLVSCLVIPVQDVSAFATIFSASLLACILVVTVVVRLQFGFSFSVGASNFVQHVQTGVYAYCRHPLLALGVLQRVVFFIGFPCMWNAVVVVWSMVLAVVVSRIEEGYLLGVTASYRCYMNAVPSRFIPRWSL